MNQDLTLAMRMFLDANGIEEGAGRAEGAIDHFVEKSKGRIESLHSGYEQLERRLASVGVAIGALEVMRESAKGDRDFTRIQLAAGATREEVAGLREEIAAMARETGNSEEALRGGFQALHESGLGWEASRQGLDAINKALADGGGNAAALTDALSQAQESFDWDLSKPHEALRLMDKLTTISRNGPANRDTLASIFAEQASDARASGFSPDSEMALIEALARSEPSAGKLQGLTRGIFKSFGSLDQRNQIHLKTGVNFLDAQGHQRDPLDVLADLQRDFSRYTSPLDQQSWMQQVFPGTDPRGQKAFRDLLSRDRINYIRDVANKGEHSEGTIERDLPAAMDNAVDQATRAGLHRASTPLILGENVLGAYGGTDLSQCFSEYYLREQEQLYDLVHTDRNLKLLALKLATDPRLTRLRRHRPYTMDCYTQIDDKMLQTRVDWERNVRFGRSQAITYTVKGWRQGNGKLWEPNQLVRVTDPYQGIDAERLITDVNYRLTGQSSQDSQGSEGGERCDITVMPVAAFSVLPHPEEDHL